MKRRADTAWIGFGINALYGVYTGVMGAVEQSWWFLALAAYYIVLAVMRFSVLLALRSAEEETERFVTRFDFMEKEAARQGKALEAMTLEEQEELWQQAKGQK